MIYHSVTMVGWRVFIKLHAVFLGGMWQHLYFSGCRLCNGASLSSHKNEVCNFDLIYFVSILCHKQFRSGFLCIIREKRNAWKTERKFSLYNAWVSGRNQPKTRTVKPRLSSIIISNFGTTKDASILGQF